MNTSYQLLKNRLTNGIPYDYNNAKSRIDHLADELVISQEQADELLSIASQNASIISAEDRIASLEAQIEKILAGEMEPATVVPDETVVVESDEEEVVVNE